VYFASVTYIIGGNRSRSYTFTVQNGEAFMGFIGRSGEVIDALGIITAITDEKHTHKKVTYHSLILTS
jgi:hypothetical protein